MLPDMPAARRLATAAAGGALAAAALTAWAASRPRRELPDVAMPVPPPGLPPGRLVTCPDLGELFVREAGDPAAPVTILLLHGWMFPSDLNWFPSYGPLSELGRVVALDHQGHGHGPRPFRPFRLVNAADDAAALLRTLGTGPVVAVGYSMGGPIAQLLWKRHPELVRGMVLCATSDVYTGAPRERLQWRGVGLLQLLLRLLPRESVERVVRAQAEGRLPVRVTALVKEDTPPEVVALLPWFLGELDRGSAEDLAEAGRELGRYDARDFLRNVDVPTVAVITTEDRLVPVARQRAMAARIPACETIEIPLDHDAAVSGADLFVPALRKAVETVIAAS